MKNTGWYKGPNLRKTKERGNLPKENAEKIGLREGKEIVSAKDILLQAEA